MYSSTVQTAKRHIACGLPGIITFVPFFAMGGRASKKFVKVPRDRYCHGNLTNKNYAVHAVHNSLLIVYKQLASVFHGPGCPRRYHTPLLPPPPPRDRVSKPLSSYIDQRSSFTSASGWTQGLVPRSLLLEDYEESLRTTRYIDDSTVCDVVQIIFQQVVKRNSWWGKPLAENRVMTSQLL